MKELLYNSIENPGRFLKVKRFLKIGRGRGSANSASINTHKYIRHNIRDKCLMVTTDISDRKQIDDYTVKLNSLKEKLIGTIMLDEKLKLITDGIVEIFDADFARIWMVKDGDLCFEGCPHVMVAEGPDVCSNRASCLHLVSSSGRYPEIDGTHRRVPLGCYKIGRVATGEDSKFITNDVVRDPRVHNHEWARKIGLISFAGYRLLSAEGRPIGVMALFSKKAILPAEERLLEDLANYTSQVLLAWEAQEALRESEEKYRAIVETYNGLIYICSEDYQIEFINEAFKTIIGHDVTGKSCYENLFGSDRVCPWCVNNRVFNGETVRLDILSPRDNRWYHVVNTPIYHTDGTRSKLSMALDITEYMKAEEKIRTLNHELEQRIIDLKVKNEELKTFSYSLSHDLKAPLIAIGGFSRKLLEKYGFSLDEKGQDYLKRIYNNSTKMEELIGSLLTFLSMGSKTIKKSRIKMEEAVREVFQQLETLYPDQTIQLKISSLPDARGDKNMIEQVLANLLSNAVKYSRTREISVIEVAGRAEGNRNVYSVKDNGIGFSMEHMNKVFKAFERLHTAEDIEGTGLGLTIVKRIIQRHGGDVWAEARDNEGATFYFSIPV